MAETKVTMGATLIAGTYLAQRKRHRPHGVCQAKLLLNLLMIGLVMWPSSQQQAKRRDGCGGIFAISVLVIFIVAAVITPTANILNICFSRPR